MNRKLFATDLDGTLLNASHQLDDVILENLDHVLQKGHVFAIATGRDMHRVDVPILDFKGRPLYTICMNGALIYDVNDTILYEQAIDSNFIEELIEHFGYLPFDFVTRTKKLVQQSKDQVMERYQDDEYSKLFSKKQIQSFFSDHVYNASKQDIVNASVLKINCRVPNPDIYKEVSAFVQKHRHQVINAPFMPDFFEFTHHKVNKGNAIQILADHVSIPNDRVFVYGDSGNDISMLKKFEHAFVPSNGTLEAKKYAKEILGDVQAYAVSKHMAKHS